MTLLEAACDVLRRADGPLHSREITRRVLADGLWATTGKTPEATLNAQISVDIKRNGERARFRRVAPGTYALNERLAPLDPVTPPIEVSGGPIPPPEPEAPTRSFTDAAEEVLTRFGQKQPMHYRAITERALDLSLVRTQGRTPEATLYAQILTEIERAGRRGESSRFVKHGKGFVGLSRWRSGGLASEIERHNANARKRLHTALSAMDPTEFEALVGRLLVELGFVDVEVTRRSADGGIDVRGTLVVGDVVRTRMAVQVKRWKQNVQAPVVQQVRGSLGAHEQGLIITTSDFGKGATNEARRPDATPVGLMNGEQLVKLLVEHDLGVTRKRYDLIELAEPGAAEPNGDPDT